MLDQEFNLNKKVVLINPPVPDERVWVREGRCQQWDIWGAPFPPLSLALISTHLISCGFETVIIDSGPEKKGIEAVLDECKKADPFFAILATTTPTIITDLGWFLPELKGALPGLKSAAIGIHVSALPEKVLECFPFLDFSIIGEPEISAKELVESVYIGSSIKEIQGIAYRTIANSIKINNQRSFIDDIDSFGLPDWDKIHFKNYMMPIIGQPYSLISFSRGCPFRCKFCATQVYNGGKLRKRSIASLVNEIKYNMSFGVSDFLFWTELMTLDKKYLNSFLDAILSENLHRKIRWVCNSRVDSADYDLFMKMRKAGCWQIAFGFEFGQNSILELANKGGKATIEQGKIAANAANKAGIVVDGHFMLGYPGETEKTMQQTISYALSLPLTFAHFYACVPFPGSSLYIESIAKGWVGGSQWSTFNQDIAAIRTDGFDPELVNSYIRKAYRKFYMRGQVLLRILKIPNNIKEVANLITLILHTAQLRR